MALQPLPLADGIRVQRLGFGTWAWGNNLPPGATSPTSYDTDTVVPSKTYALRP